VWRKECGLVVSAVRGRAVGSQLHGGKHGFFQFLELLFQISQFLLNCVRGACVACARSVRVAPLSRGGLGGRFLGLVRCAFLRIRWRLVLPFIVAAGVWFSPGGSTMVLVARWGSALGARSVVASIRSGLDHCSKCSKGCCEDPAGVVGFSLILILLVSVLAIVTGAVLRGTFFLAWVSSFLVCTWVFAPFLFLSPMSGRIPGPRAPKVDVRGALSG